MNKIIVCLFLFLFSFFSACENQNPLLSNLITGDYSGVENGTYISGDTTDMTELEIEVIKEINKLRSNPQLWMRKHKADRPDNGDMWTEPRPVGPNYATPDWTMKGREPVHQLSVLKGINKAAAGYANEQTLEYGRWMWHYLHQYVEGDFIVDCRDGYYEFDTISGGYAYYIIGGLNIIESGKNSLADLGYNNATDAESIVYWHLKDRLNRNAIMNTNYRFVGIGWGANGNVICFLGNGRDKVAVGN